MDGLLLYSRASLLWIRLMCCPFSSQSLLFPSQSQHHCILCGDVFCNDCSSYYTFTPHLGYSTKQRTCKVCRGADGRRGLVTGRPLQLVIAGCCPLETRGHSNKSVHT